MINYDANKIMMVLKMTHNNNELVFDHGIALSDKIRISILYTM